MLASRGGHEAVVRRLLDAGAVVDRTLVRACVSFPPPPTSPPTPLDFMWPSLWLYTAPLFATCYPALAAPVTFAYRATA